MTSRPPAPYLPGLPGVPGSPPLPAAVLWDMDGTLVDTEPYWFASERDVVEQAGGTWTDDQGRALVGRSILGSAEVIRQEAGLAEPAEWIADAMVDGVLARLTERVPWLPGVPELLDALVRAGVRNALVTMSYRPLAGAITAALPPGTFSALVTGDQVRRGKPDPEPYLLAAGQLGVDPGDCLAIEDSPAGVESARAAGVPVLAVRGQVPVPPAPGVRLVPGLAGLSPERLGAWAEELRPARA